MGRREAQGGKSKHFLLAAGPCIPLGIAWLGDGKVGSGFIWDFHLPHHRFSTFVVLPAWLERVHG